LPSRKVLYLEPSIKGDFRCFFAAPQLRDRGVKKGKPFYTPVSGALDIKEIRHKSATLQ